MIFGFSGAELTGKTELVNHLADALNEIGYRTVIVPDTSKQVLLEWGMDYTEVAKDTQLLFEYFREVIKRCLYYTHKYLSDRDIDIILSDRTPFDYMVYAMLAKKIGFLAQVVSRFNFDDIIYDALFLLSPVPEINVKYPTEDVIGQWHINQVMQEMLPVDYYVPPLPVDKRVKHVLNILTEDELL